MTFTFHQKLTLIIVNIEGKAHSDNASQNIHPPLMQKDTHTHTTTHTLHHSYIYYLKYTRDIHEAKVKIGVPPCQCQ